PSVPLGRRLSHAARGRRTRDLRSAGAPRRGRSLPVEPQSDVHGAPHLLRGNRARARLVGGGGGARFPPGMVRPAGEGGRGAARGAFRRAVPRVPPPREALDSRRAVTGLIGDGYALASASCFAAANVLIARGAKLGDADNGAFVSLLLTAAISGAGWIALGIARGFEPVTTNALLWFAGAGVFTAYIGRVFFYASVQHLGAMR